MRVIKRNGTEVPFDYGKIKPAVQAANTEVDPTEQMSDAVMEHLALKIESDCRQLNRSIPVEELQDRIVDELFESGYYAVMKCFLEYRYRHALIRKGNTTDGKILSLLRRNNEEAMEENANKNPIINSTLRDYMAGEMSRDLVRRFFMPEDVMKAHDEGIIHVHDTDYISEPLYNCCLINLEDMLQNGTVISGTMIEKPHSFFTACNVATQIVAQVASSQFGGQTFTLAHLAPFVDISRQRLREEVAAEWDAIGKEYTEPERNHIAEARLRREIRSGVQTIQYQIITLMTTNGQAPFVSVFMYLDEVPEGRTRDDLALIIEEVLRQRLQGVKNEKGAWVTPAFPKLLYCLDEDNIYDDSKYWYLTKLAARCTAKRLVPDYISAKVMRKLRGDVYPCMGCRSFLTPAGKVLNDDGTPKYYGRFNQGVVTINLVDVACASGGNEKKFWKLMEERSELCKKALMCRHDRLIGTPSDVAPILWQHGAIARLKKGEKIDPLLSGNYSTISFGYAGLAECTWRMKGCSHTEPEGKKFALKVMRFLNDKCMKWRAETDISFSLYGTPIEAVTYRFAKALQKRWGVIPQVTDRNFVTNSYHVSVFEDIDAFSKISFESEFQELSPGGAITYVEVPDMQNNIPAVLAVIRHIYENIMYAELNTKSDYCQVCGYDGEIRIVDDGGKLMWECPNCGNRDHSRMNVARRVCGYISTNQFNQGRMAEIRDRKLHTSVSMMKGGC